MKTDETDYTWSEWDNSAADISSECMTASKIDKIWEVQSGSSSNRKLADGYTISNLSNYTVPFSGDRSATITAGSYNTAFTHTWTVTHNSAAVNVETYYLHENGVYNAGISSSTRSMQLDKALGSSASKYFNAGSSNWSVVASNGDVLASI